MIPDLSSPSLPWLVQVVVDVVVTVGFGVGWLVIGAGSLAMVIGTGFYVIEWVSALRDWLFGKKGPPPEKIVRPAAKEIRDIGAIARSNVRGVSEEYQDQVKNILRR